jgi:hypothetical protein
MSWRASAGAPVAVELIVYASNPDSGIQNPWDSTETTTPAWTEIQVTRIATTGVTMLTLNMVLPVGTDGGCFLLDDAWLVAPP